MGTREARPDALATLMHGHNGVLTGPMENSLGRETDRSRIDVSERCRRWNLP